MQRGFSAIEILAALSLFAAMFVAFASISTSTIKANHEARRITAASNLARDKVEELRAADFTTLASGADGSPLTETGQTGGPGAIYTRSWTVIAGPSTTTKEVTITVQWTDETPHNIQLKTLIGS
jgi:prepilin-type N-terminal cleavage/methylation domain-containing protein